MTIIVMMTRNLTEIPNNGIKEINWMFFWELKNILKQVIDESSYDPDVRGFAEKLTSGTDMDYRKKIFNIKNYIDKHFSFNRDPKGREYITLPKKYVRQLQAGKPISGDCDDAVVLLCSLFKSLGFDCYMVFISPLEYPPFTHVLAAVDDNTGETHLIDLVNQEKLTHTGKIKVVKV